MDFKKYSDKLFNWSFLGILALGLIIVNILGAYLYFRLDTTSDQRYSLSPGTVSFLKNKNNFENRLSIKIYLDGNLPAEIRLFRNTLEDRLKEFKSIVGDRIEYIFIDPNKGTEEEKKELYKTLYDGGKGIIPLDLSYMKDGSQNQLLLWPGATIDYGGTTVNIIQFLPGSQSGKPLALNEMAEIIDQAINNLEYNIISAIRRSIQKTKPKIGFLQGHGELNYAQTLRARSLLKPYYKIKDVTIGDSLAALNDLDGLIIARPKQQFSLKELYIIDQFVMRGGRLMCFVDALDFSQDSLKANGVTYTTRINTGLDKMLFDYGMKLQDDYVLDVNCAPMLFPYAKNALAPWFYYIMASPTEHPISRNIEPVLLKYASRIEFVKKDSIAYSAVLTSSTNSNSQGMAPIISLEMPRLMKNNPNLVKNPDDKNNKLCLAGLVEGKFQSHFKNRIVDEFAKNPDAKYMEKGIKDGKVMLVGNGSWLRNSYDSIQGKDGKFMYRAKPINDLKYDPKLAEMNVPLIFGNQEFLQNLVDYMMGENSIIDIRSKQIDLRPIDKEKVKKKAGMLRILNILLPVSLILILGSSFYYFRKRKYAKLK
jgi:gliding-associated putative ABC transporter substrate-binding component GldG